MVTFLGANDLNFLGRKPSYKRSSKVFLKIFNLCYFMLSQSTSELEQTCGRNTALVAYVLSSKHQKVYHVTDAIRRYETQTL
jgi:hypothetical protein